MNISITSLVIEKVLRLRADIGPVILRLNILGMSSIIPL